MSRNLKVLTLIDIPWHSGLAAYAFDQAAALAGRGHRVFFAAPENSAAAAFALANGFPLTVIPPRKSYMLLGALMKLKRLIETEAIDVVGAHTGKTQTMAWLLSLVSSRPFSIIRTKADAKRPSAGLSLGKTARIIAGSDAIMNMFVSAGLSAGKVETVYQGIAVPQAAAKTPSAPLRVGILGRLDPVKGHACFIEAAALVLQKVRDAEFLIAGREENVKYAELEALAARLGLAGRVKYLGHVPDAVDFCRSCDVGVIASLDSEAVSRAALEWLAAGRPLVAASVGSLPEFVGPEWQVPPGDPAMLAEKLISLLTAPEKMLAAGAANRAKALADFNPAAFAERTERIFNEAVGPH